MKPTILLVLIAGLCGCQGAKTAGAFLLNDKDYFQSHLQPEGTYEVMKSQRRLERELRDEPEANIIDEQYPEDWALPTIYRASYEELQKRIDMLNWRETILRAGLERDDEERLKPLPQVIPI